MGAHISPKLQRETLWENWGCLWEDSQPPQKEEEKGCRKKSCENSSQKTIVAVKLCILILCLHYGFPSFACVFHFFSDCVSTSWVEIKSGIVCFFIKDYIFKYSILIIYTNMIETWVETTPQIGPLHKIRPFLLFNVFVNTPSVPINMKRLFFGMRFYVVVFWVNEDRIK